MRVYLFMAIFLLFSIGHAIQINDNSKSYDIDEDHDNVLKINGKRTNMTITNTLSVEKKNGSIVINGVPLANIQYDSTPSKPPISYNSHSINSINAHILNMVPILLIVIIIIKP
jgi:hypothetical protein